VLNLATTSSVLQVVTGSAIAAIECHASWLDLSVVGTTIGPGAENTQATAVTTTTIVPAPGPGIVRNVKFFSVVNIDKALSCQVVVQVDDGVEAINVAPPVTLLPGWMLQYNTDGSGIVVYDATGAIQ